VKKFVFVLLLVCIVAAQGFGQSDRRGSQSGGSKLPPFLGGDVSGRPSRTPAPSTSPTPAPAQLPRPEIVDDEPQPQEERRGEKPVLQRRNPSGGTLPAPQASPTPNAGTGETVEDDGEVIRVETSIVTIPVTVLDRQGRYVPNLQQADFEIYEDNKKQEIAEFTKTEQPFTVVLLLDVSNSTQFKIDEIQKAAIAFVRQLKANDKVMVISFDEQVRVLSEPTSDRRRLEYAIMQANFGGGTSLYDAVDYAINRRLSRIEGRKAVVLFTDGVDTTSKLSSYNSSIRDSEEQESTIYTIHYNTYDEMQAQNGGSNYPQRRRRGGIGGILGDILGGGIIIGGGNTGGGRGTSRADYEQGERYVEELATRTGGRMYRADSTQNLESAFYNIAEELRRQYSISYYPAEVGQSGQRKAIKVRVRQPNLVVRARDSYIVGQNDNPTAARNFN
jgi:Ca-activated chloride channel homolog